ncbi:50S ribosomal protein L25 [Paenibacillus sp. SYP-B3998]|uniref:Large ribosomal subunit protein bL25 n=1 Tax=Paenibacillus sp. SYP-B3998 TaxID=2678564 RepID=A0A6G4A5C6_9BACL|nr:50S ribosomal protein L25 [Paenibacillus sp. SYP-B3998]NEW09595.1 50S ribosomal protein L25 [Paenibacillus sp. SYP-B3998]
MPLTLKVEARKDTTKSDIKQLRAKGKIPGVVYGKKVHSTVITIDEKELRALLRKNPHAIIELELPDGGGKQPVMMTELQRGKVSKEILHVDFHQINMDEPVRTVVSLEFIGEAEGAKEGGIVQVQLHELEIRCLPNQIPSFIQVDISNLGLGENILVSNLSVSAEIEVKSDPNELIVTVLAPQKEEAAEEVVLLDEKAEQADTASETAKQEQTV